MQPLYICTLQGCRVAIFFINISRYFFGHMAIQTYMGIDGIYGDRRKNRRRKTKIYTMSHSADATSVGPHTYIRIPLPCCVHIYCQLSAPFEIKISRPCIKVFKRVTANAYNKYLYFTILYMHYFLKYCHGRVHGYIELYR